LQEVECDTVDPIGSPMRAQYLVNKDHAFIELASTSGLVLLREEERNPLHTSTCGTGLMIKDAIARGKQNIYLLVGERDQRHGIRYCVSSRYSIRRGNLRIYFWK